MEYVVLDTNFIIYCVEKRIDFFSYFEEEGMKVIIPNQVIFELRRLSLSSKGKTKKLASLSLKILSKNEFEKVYLNKKITDDGLVELIKCNPRFIIATLDKKLQNRINGKKITIRGSKRIEIIQ